jgi:hypothetical protein
MMVECDLIVTSLFSEERLKVKTPCGNMEMYNP